MGERLIPIIDLWVYATLLLAFVALFTREVIAPASRNHCDRRWLIMSASIGVITVVVTLLLGWVFAHGIRAHALWPVPPDWPAAAVGGLSFLLTSFIFYWWHRLIHASDWLWRWTHQLHHSALRIESLTAFYAHPLDTAAAVLIGCLSSYVVLGASPMAAAWALLWTGLFELFLHADMRTPRWLGWFIQRPEMHRIHHAHGHHAQNYGLPIWDALFGTLHNPRDWPQRCGFDEERSAQVHDMLMGRDVHRG